MSWTDPPTVATGDRWYASDQNTYIRDNENWLKAWVDEGRIPSGTEFPSSPSVGDPFFRTDLNQLYEYTTDWTEIPVSSRRPELRVLKDLPCNRAERELDGFIA